MLIRPAITLMLFYTLSSICVSAQTSTFTYQGRLTDNGTQPTDTYAMEFRLFGSSTDKDQIGTPLTFDGVGPNPAPVRVANGVFTVQLDFGGATAFDGNPRWLQIAVKKPTDSLFVTLSPRQALTSTPYALRTVVATSADALSDACTLCVTDAHIQAVKGSKVIGKVANADNASTAENVTGVVQIANGGTGSSTQNFIDLATDQTVAGKKSFTDIGGNGSRLTNLNGANITGASITSEQLSSDTLPNSHNLALLGSLRWDLLRPQRNFPVGPTPHGIAFDGKNVWVTNNSENNVTKLRASDGVALGTFPVGVHPEGVAFDGSNIWVVNTGTGLVGNGTLTKLRASDGICVGTCTFPIGGSPTGIAFDGENLWVTNTGSGLTKVRASDGLIVGTFTGLVEANGIAFDGTSIWIVSLIGAMRLQASDGACVGTCTIPLGSTGVGIAFDGDNVWIGHINGLGVPEVRKFRASDGNLIGTFPVAGRVVAIAFDGANIWVTSTVTGNNVTKLRASDGTNLGTFPVSGVPQGIAFDGENIWVTNTNSNNVTRFQPAFPQ